MSMSIAELDTIVRTFYEGRGEAVSFWHPSLPYLATNIAVFLQHKQAQTALNQVSRTLLQDLLPHAHILQFRENPDSWLLVDKILQDATHPQTKCSCKGH